MIPLRARVHLAHAAVARLLGDVGIRALHIKGYAALPGSYRPDRGSTDVDLLVHPDDASRAVALLSESGWPVATDFSQGSIFGHAATLRHGQLGYVDVHRWFPGIGLDPAIAFEELWSTRAERCLAGHRIPVPDRPHQRLLILLHAARDTVRRRSDVLHIRTSSERGEWEHLCTLAIAFRAQAAWEAATHEPLPGADPDETALFQAMAAGHSGLQLFGARWRATHGVRSRVRLVLTTVRVNRARLSMDLGRPATTTDALRWQGDRVAQVGRWVLRRLRAAGPGRGDAPPGHHTAEQRKDP
ncbi:nucleotidyltransferase family protein [Micrococcus lylae]|uniref:nucleotidyltransferase family protein n=1 Tax=Micrococcus lylae TaxID=1273 RepID=UPI0021A609F6|nr:nucleotidyltransferase family protein [Micrococcus lylae]MCT2006779.1 nucleotidyltransferase family protein [Micrococcus lylae]MCT2070687.1 nucleotidyltransferase family protein [Micrococcus lylae]